MSHHRIGKRPDSARITILINGLEYPAYRGETVFAALSATGHRALRKSCVRKEPRGGFCGMGACYECLVSIDGRPNQRACMIQVEDRMEIVLDEA
jgi:predicted molibdopterin-dependent oxidoreductase YjgC